MGAALLSLVLTLAPLGAGAVEAGDVDLPLGPHATFALDPEGALSPEVVLARARRGELAPFVTPIRSFGPSEVALWLHLVLVGGPASGDLAISWDRPLVDHLDLWVVRAGRIDHLRGGLAIPAGERTFRDYGVLHAAPLRLEPGERVEVVLRAQTRRILLAEASLRHAATVQPRDARQGAYLGMLAGIMSIVTLMAAWSWWTLRDRWSLRLVGVLATFGGYLGAETGLLRALWTIPATLAQAAPSVAALGCAIFGLAYSRVFVSARERFPRLDRAAGVVQAAGLLSLPVPFLAPTAGAALAIANVACTFGLMMLLGVHALGTGERAARYFLASASIMSSVGLVYLLALLGLGPATAVTLSGFHVALWVGGVVLLVSLVDRVNEERGQARARLEQEVADRTASLQETVVRLGESEERFRVAFQVSPEAIAIARLEDGICLAVNRGFGQVTGYAEEELLGRVEPPDGLWPEPADRERLFQTLRDGGRVDNLEIRLRRKDGREVTGLTSAQRITLGGQEVVLSVTRDITDRKAAEAERDRLAEQLRESQKMEAIGRLAGGVAHDFNNLLTVMSTNVSLAELELQTGDPSLPYFQEIGEASIRAGHLTRQLLAFSRRQVLAPQPIDLMALVGGMRNMLRRLLGEDLELVIQRPGACAPAMADAHQLEQVVVNLTVNARDALPGGGRIAISACEVEIAPGGALLDRRPGRYVALVVEDDGIGMSQEVQARAFEPFFTTRKGRGTGLGLSTVYGIAAQHGGFAEVTSAPGCGTTFRIHFPLAHALVRVDAAPPLGTLRMPRGRETILLAEDEEAVRRSTAIFLRKLGYRVLEAPDGQAALEAARGQPVDLLLTDVIMPRMNGRELADRFRLLHAGAGLLFMSGYTDEVIDRAGVLEPGLRLVQKPFDLAELAAAVREALDRRAPVAASVGRLAEVPSPS